MNEFKESVIRTALSQDDANRLRSTLVKNVRGIWVTVMRRRSTSPFDVMIANEWGGPPSTLQQELAKTLAEGLELNEQIDDDDVITLRDHEIETITQ